MTESFCDVDGVVALGANYAIELLAVHWQRHFNIFDLLRFGVCQQINQFLAMLQIVLFGFSKVKLKNLSLELTYLL